MGSIDPKELEWAYKLAETATSLLAEALDITMGEACGRVYVRQNKGAAPFDTEQVGRGGGLQGPGAEECPPFVEPEGKGPDHDPGVH